MKNILLFLMFLLSGMAGAQIVDIPDAAFKQYLLQGFGKDSSGNVIPINSNGDNEIQIIEALQIWELEVVTYMNLTTMEGINDFVNLRRLYLVDLNIQILNINLLNLEHLSIFQVDSEQINLQAPALKILYVGVEYLAAFDTSGLPSLEELTLYYAGNLTINPLINTNLRKIDLTDVWFNDFDFSVLSSLEDVRFFNSNLNSLNFSGLTGLKKIYIDFCYLQTLNLEGVENLEDFTFESIYDVTSLDLSSCTALKNLSLDFGMYQTEAFFLNLKNGIEQYESLSLSLDGSELSPLYICIDEGNESLLPANVFSNPDILISTYCSFTPGGNYNTVEGTLTFDSDNNGCGLDDAYSGLVRMNIDNGIESFSTFTASGLYNFYVQSGTFTLTPQMENNWFTITPPSATIILPTVDNSTTNQNFCITANGVHPDVEVAIVPVVAAQPGFDAVYKIVYKTKVTRRCQVV